MHAPRRPFTVAIVRQRLIQLENTLSKNDLDRLEAILPLFGNNQNPEAPLADCLELLFSESTTQNPLADFRAFRSRLKDAAVKVGMGLELAVDSKKRSDPSERRCWFTLPPDPAADHIADWTEQETASDNDVSNIRSHAVLVPCRLTVAFKAQDRDLAESFLQRLRRHVDAWGLENHDVSESDNPVQAFQEAVEEGGDIGLWMMPAAWGKERLVVPVDLGSFKNCADKDRFVLEHAEKIRQCLSMREEERRKKEEKLAQDLTDKAGTPSDLLYLVGAKAQETSVEPAAATFIPQGRQVVAIDELMAWVSDKDGAPYCVLLGEYGIGKTTTLKQFAQSLLAQRRKGEDVPLPIFIDLRAYSDTIRKGSVPNLETLLQEVLGQVWKASKELPFTAQNILRLVQEEGAVLIFDGLDEKLVHLDEIQGHAFLRSLWQALPPSSFHPDSGTAGKPGRLVFSCRSHYFKTLRDQNATLRGEDRDGIRADHYRAWYLLPFDDDQTRDYLSQALEVERDSQQVESVLELLESVHNLRELAPRPYLLSLMAKHIGELQRRRAQGEVVRGVMLYESLVDEWLARDNYKHKLRPEDKLYLMEDIAAEMWREGAREWPWNRVLDWLTQRLDERTVWRVRYLRSQVPLELLEEDFRTATFVLRPHDSQDRFRFAHTSFQEYFLARYLHRTLAADESQHCEMPHPSLETLDFLGQLLDTVPEIQDKVLRSMETILEQPPGQATEIVFRYWLYAAEHRLPEPQPQKVKLQGIDLSGLTVCGRSTDQKFNLFAADLSESNLVGSRFVDVDLSQANLSGVQAEGAEFHRVTARSIDLADANLTASVWRHTDISGLQGGEKAIWDDVQLVACDLDENDLPADFRRAGTLSDPRDRARSIPPAEVASETSKVITLLGHADSILACAITPDGRRLVSGSHDRTLKLWDLESGRYLRTFEEHEDWVLACAITPDGRRVVSGSNDRTLKIWNLKSGRCLHTFEGHKAGVRACAITPDGRRVVSGSDDCTLKIWDLKSGRCLRTLEGHVDWVRACAITPDGRRVVSGSNDRTLKIWDLESGDCLRTFEGHAGVVLAGVIAPDGRRLVSGSHDRTLKIWDLESGDCLRTLEGHKNEVPACAITPDGRRLASGSDDRTLKIWDLKSGDCLRTLEGHVDWVRACAITPGGHRLVSGSRDSTLKIWDLDSGRCLRTLGHTGAVWTCAVTPDGRRLVSGSYDRTLKLWDLESGSCLRTLPHTGAVWTCAVTPDGNRLASGSDDCTLKLWDLESGRCLRTLKGHNDWVMACAITPDGRRLASGSSDRTLKLGALEWGHCRHTFEGHNDWVMACAVTPDGRRLVSGSRDSTLKLWDLESGDCLRTFKGHADWVMACAITPDGRRLASGSNDRTLKLWDLESGDCLRTFKGHKHWVRACAITPDGQRVVSGSNDRTLKVWDLESGRCLRTLRHTGVVLAGVITSDGRHLVSGARNSTLGIWNLESYALKITLINGPNGETAALDYDANRILSRSSEAWRFLGWRYFDPVAERLRVLPAEHFEPLTTELDRPI